MDDRIAGKDGAIEGSIYGQQITHAFFKTPKLCVALPEWQ